MCTILFKVKIHNNYLRLLEPVFLIAMEVPQVTIKQEKDDNLTFTTEFNVNYTTPIFDLQDIKQEFVKVEPCFDVYEPTELDQELKLSEETHTIVNDDKYMLDCS